MRSVRTVTASYGSHTRLSLLLSARVMAVQPDSQGRFDSYGRLDRAALARLFAFAGSGPAFLFLLVSHIFPLHIFPFSKST